MVGTIENHPECALGISKEVVDGLKPYPFVMQPKETFRREYLQRGVLGTEPSATILRRDVLKT